MRPRVLRQCLFFFQAEDGIRDVAVTGVQTCALPILRLERGAGSDVVVELTRGGPDAGKLQIATGPLRGRETLRITYPDDEIVYRELGRGANTTLRVRDDGTFNDREDRGRGGHRSDEGRRV